MRKNRRRKDEEMKIFDNLRCCANLRLSELRVKTFLNVFWVNDFSNLFLFIPVTFDLVRKIALQSIGIEKRTRSALLDVTSTLMTVDEKFAIRRISELPSSIGTRTFCDSRSFVVSGHCVTSCKRSWSFHFHHRWLLHLSNNNESKEP